MSSILEQQIGLHQLSSDTFAAGWHSDWAIGPTLLGGCVISMVQLAAQAYLRTDPALVKVNQPDILSLHVEFIRTCTHNDSIIRVIPLKIGSSVSTLQLQLLQNDKVKVIALANSTNFDITLGPSASKSESWELSPRPNPKPDFDAVLAHKPDPNWVPAVFNGEVLPMTNRLLVLEPRNGFPHHGVCDAWNGFMGDERIDATYLPVMAEIMPSLSDTLLQNGGPYDARVIHEKAAQWAEKNPGVPLVMDSNSVSEITQVATVNITLSLDIEYKRRLPKDGLRFTFTRATAKTLLDGRMDVDLTLCNEDMDVVCLARQLVLVLGMHRKFGSEAKQAEPKL